MQKVLSQGTEKEGIGTFFQGLARPNQSSQKQSYDLQESTLMTERFAPVNLVHEFLEVTSMRFICARQVVLLCFAGD